MNISKIGCISCGKSLADDIVVIGDQYPSAIFSDEKDTFADNLKPSSLNITKCTNEECGLVQLANKYDLDCVFKHYPYESGSTATMKSILQNVVDDTTQKVSLDKDDVVLDIGGNDGTLLNLIPQPVKARVNIDAAWMNQVVLDDNYTYVHSKFSSDVYHSLNLPNPKLIFSIAMFYHLNNPVEFCRNIYDIMDDNTVWVLQMTYLGTMLRNNILDNIVHEHAAYYSLFSLESLLNRNGLHIADASIVNSYGGSLRIFVVKKPSQFPKKYWRKQYKDVQDFETKYQTNTHETLFAFNERVQLLCKSIKATVNHIVWRYGPIWGFGASTKGNMLLQFLGINTNQISCILDNSPKKIGKKTMGSSIPIVEEEVYLKNIIPSYLFILPYYYMDAFIPIIQKHCIRPIHLFVPLPYPYFITVLPKGVTSEKQIR